MVAPPGFLRAMASGGPVGKVGEGGVQYVGKGEYTKVGARKHTPVTWRLCLVGAGEKKRENTQGAGRLLQVPRVMTRRGTCAERNFSRDV